MSSEPLGPAGADGAARDGGAGPSRLEWRTTTLGWIALVGAVLVAAPRLWGSTIAFATMVPPSLVELVSVGLAVFVQPLSLVPFVVSVVTATVGVTAFVRSPRERRDAVGLGARIDEPHRLASLVLGVDASGCVRSLG